MAKTAMARMTRLIVLPNSMLRMAGEEATKKAVAAVTSRPTVIHWYTWRIKTDATLRLAARVVSRKLSIDVNLRAKGGCGVP